MKVERIRQPFLHVVTRPRYQPASEVDSGTINIPKRAENARIARPEGTSSANTRFWESLRFLIASERPFTTGSRGRVTCAHCSLRVERASIPMTFPRDQCLDPNPIAQRGLRLPESGAGDGNRTHGSSLGSLGITIIRRPLELMILVVFRAKANCGPQKGEAPCGASPITLSTDQAV
jgi:hypothetical protein